MAYMIDSFPIAQFLPKCSKAGKREVAWQFLGLSIPEWALVWFVLFIIGAVLALARRGR
jgi:disulfide bond formation protein DsbB